MVVEDRGDFIEGSLDTVDSCVHPISSGDDVERDILQKGGAVDSLLQNVCYEECFEDIPPGSQGVQVNKLTPTFVDGQQNRYNQLFLVFGRGLTAPPDCYFQYHNFTNTKPVDPTTFFSLFPQGLDGAWLRHYSWRCQPVDWTESPPAMRVARGCYVYFLAKLSELLDTVFFTLRKKDKQISFLHLYHHTVMPMISWGATKYYPGGHGTFIGVINSFVHIVMYSYYMMAAMGPQFHKYLWWKKYITDLQMIQFGMAFMHSAQLLWTDCGYPRWSVCFTLPNAIFFYMLFNDFYKNTYGVRRAARLAAAKRKAEEERVLREIHGKPADKEL
ncbi:elongation of very long chain fatty acids protein AAEL008004-like [Topomyia yanbarensis]|uniref:elongation of very long chain fatty acids protein AAEL008004-like n=1 Tax=Topomyia yanbarensis TaxID=2498891 RepID=UPI00273AD403|nr:elongation of very long chain fatty acids protein AAEL008004-like [Topomyia yanbarensis]